MLYNLSKSSDTITLSLKGSQTTLKHIIENLRDGKYTLEIKRKPEKPSWDQFKYYRGGILPYLGDKYWEIYSGIPEELAKEILASFHEDLLLRFAPKIEQRNRFDKRKKTIKITRTSEMTKEQFTDFINAILLYFPEIPTPEDHKAQLLYESMKEYHNYF